MPAPLDKPLLRVNRDRLPLTLSTTPSSVVPVVLVVAPQLHKQVLLRLNKLLVPKPTQPTLMPNALVVRVLRSSQRT
jgi:hypothetical protein